MDRSSSETENDDRAPLGGSGKRESSRWLGDEPNRAVESRCGVDGRLRGGVPDTGGVDPKCEVGALNMVEDRLRREGRSSGSANFRVSTPYEEIDDAIDILAGVVMPSPMRWLEEVLGVPSKLA